MSEVDDIRAQMEQLYARCRALAEEHREASQEFMRLQKRLLELTGRDVGTFDAEKPSTQI